MNFELFIAKKIIARNSFAKSGTRPIIKIAISSIVLGLAVMIVASAIVTGFQNEIRERVIGFGSHIQITGFDANSAIESRPISKNQSFYPHLDTVSGVRHIQYYATKAGILKKDENIHGVVIKGIGPNFDWDFFNNKIIEGEAFELNDTAKSNYTLISKPIASKLKLRVGDDVTAYFIQDPPRARKFTISGIYESGLEKFDNTFILADIQHIQKLNDWSEDQVSGFEVILDNYRELDHLDEFIYKYIGYDLNTVKITDRNKEIFSWLELQDWNVVIIITLMILVAGINMISTLLILILERTNMIGLLKALGAQNKSIQRIFLYNASYLIGKGLLYGNFLGIVLCLLQLRFSIITLPKESYYISHVPINIDLFNIILLNIGTFVLCFLMLLLPSHLITRITPVKAIRFN